MTYPNTSVYYGQWVNGLKDGFGQYIGISGETIIGKWENDVLKEGICIFPDESKYFGHFKDSKHNGFGSLILNDGTIQQGIWKDGVLVNGLSHSRDKISTVVNNQVFIHEDEN